MPAIEVWRGSPNTWECDEMGHMNVRFYVAKMMEGLAWLAAELGMPDAFAPGGVATLLPVDQHIRFLREARPGAPLHMRAGVLEMGEADATVFLELIHAGDGSPAATCRMIVRHVEARTGKPFAFGGRTRDLAGGLLTAVPAHGQPRSVDLSAAPMAADRDIAERLGVSPIGRGVVDPSQCDAFGRMKPEFCIGRVSDSVPNLLAAWREKVTRAASEKDGQARQSGAAVLEYRLAYRRWPCAGDRIEVRSGVVRVGEKTHALVHWLVDPDGGPAWCTSEAVAVTFDLKTRKVIAAPPEHRAELEALTIEGLAI